MKTQKKPQSNSLQEKKGKLQNDYVHKFAQQ